ncbi:unnamed protein product [Acanthoscelides obtectus]|uniref:PiggyBac transposable element-derived protein domain-containing protein n=1 Tax=Acanthoscelides obtectus TaxID=200917 RepID=A0A9P0LML8_ACAOB|nr:unnamed protein product [Acanthoscelides obtectus]CAK1650061.1 PiggyBac transposable element-derived protein 4 [Acanthoscelides obtectus]
MALESCKLNAVLQIAVDLRDKLVKRRRDSVGTMIINRKGIPREFNVKLQRGEIVTRFRRKLMIQKWRDKKDVLMISTVHDDSMKTIAARCGDIEKPSCKIDYNASMGGVDLSDNYLHFYGIARTRVKKWYMKTFIGKLKRLFTGAGCVSITANEVRTLNANKGYDWTCVDCRAIGKDIKGLRALIIELQNDIISEVIERQKRKTNIILFNVKEPDQAKSKKEQTESDSTTVLDIVSKVDPELTLTNLKPIRLGPFAGNKIRPIKITVESPDIAQKVAMNARKLNTSRIYRNVRIAPDRTKKQLEYYKEVKRELTERHNAAKEEMVRNTSTTVVMWDVDASKPFLKTSLCSSRCFVEQFHYSSDVSSDEERNEFDICAQKFLLGEEVNKNIELSLRTAAIKHSDNVLCNSKCHNSSKSHVLICKF